MNNNKARNKHEVNVELSYLNVGACACFLTRMRRDLQLYRNGDELHQRTGNLLD